MKKQGPGERMQSDPKLKFHLFHWNHGRRSFQNIYTYTFPETNIIAPENRPGPKRNLIFLPLFFRGKLAVSFREGTAIEDETLENFRGILESLDHIDRIELPPQENQPKNCS